MRLVCIPNISDVRITWGHSPVNTLTILYRKGYILLIDPKDARRTENEESIVQIEKKYLVEFLRMVTLQNIKIISYAQCIKDKEMSKQHRTITSKIGLYTTIKMKTN